MRGRAYFMILECIKRIILPCTAPLRSRLCKFGRSFRISSKFQRACRQRNHTRQARGPHSHIPEFRIL